jgi:2-keto-4-pentenoate hydratase/2-oxohepta-3-ene-1,7-dioic acid hydratase in catechol pathway
MYTLARIERDDSMLWIVSADGGRTWINLETFGPVPPSLPGAIAAFRLLPRDWSHVSRSHSVDVKALRAPTPHPGKIIGIAANFADHAAEVGLQDLPDLRLFAKFHTAVTGPWATIRVAHDVTQQLDYEGELAVIIGTHVRVGAVLDDPMSAVFGYAVANDVSARDIQRIEGQLTHAKSLDTFLPIGPWITVRTPGEDALADRVLTTYVNGEIRQQSRLSAMIRDVPTLIRDISSRISLNVGDVILTGSPGGSGIGMEPPRFLSDEDIVTCEITGLGRITNRVRIVSHAARAGATAAMAP